MGAQDEEFVVDVSLSHPPQWKELDAADVVDDHAWVDDAALVVVLEELEELEELEDGAAAEVDGW